MSFRGQCLCGEVKYEMDQLDGPIVHCHCATCRKAQAAAFASTARVNREHFRWLRGEALLASYESSPGKQRRFCSRCGCHLMAERAHQEHVILRVATLDDDPGSAPAMHIWASHDVAWLHAPPGIPRYAEQPPDSAEPAPGRDLQLLLASLDPSLADTAFTFASLPNAVMPEALRLEPVGVFSEPEGISVICPHELAERLGLPNAGAYRRITLDVHSSLEAVGLTAAVASRLAEHGISTNMVAGYHHDHLFIPERDAVRAEQALRTLQAEVVAAMKGP